MRGLTGAAVTLVVVAVLILGAVTWLQGEAASNDVLDAGLKLLGDLLSWATGALVELVRESL